MTDARMIYLHALSPVHSGTGQAASVIDLPIAREKVTGWPVIPSSSLKGVLRSALEGEADAAWITRAFGKMEEAGALCFGDMRIVCLPVRSLYGTYANVTCPLALSRLARDFRAAELEPPFDEAKIGTIEEMGALVPEVNALAPEGTLYLEDLDLKATAGAAAGTIGAAIARAVFPDVDAERAVFERRLAVIGDDVFNFLSLTATEVAARVRLEEDTKTVERGGLWYEEAVPAETIFAGPVVAAGHARDAEGLLAPLTSRTIQIGGKASVGRGLCRMVVVVAPRVAP